MTNNNNNKRRAAFRDAISTELHSQSEKTLRFGENGCPEYSTTGDDILDLSQCVRGMDRRIVRERCDKILLRASAAASEQEQQQRRSDVLRDVVDLIVLTFLTRNVRGGKGEKDLSYVLYGSIFRHFPETAKKLLPLFATHYGYWKDLLLLASNNKSNNKNKNNHDNAFLLEAIALMKNQLRSDLETVAEYEASMEGRQEQEQLLPEQEPQQPQGQTKTDRKDLGGPKISLLAKWLPRENSHFDKRLGFVKLFVETEEEEATTKTTTTDSDNNCWQSMSRKMYRKQVAKLTSYLDLPEVYLSAQREDEIVFGKMASKATLKLSRALLNEAAYSNDDDGAMRRRNHPKRQRCARLFLEHLVRNGLNGKTLMPHEIVGEILRCNCDVSPSRTKVLDALWKDLWKDVVNQARARAEEDNNNNNGGGSGGRFDPSHMVPLSDVSGSMHGRPMEVAIAMGIGISEITHPSFRNLVLTFESSPRWHELQPHHTIVQKVRSLRDAPWGGSTNMEAAWDRILDLCIEHRLAREDVPSLIVFSDMQFDQASGCGYYYGTNSTRTATRMETMHEVIKGKFAAVGQRLGWDKDSSSSSSSSEAVLPPPIVYWNLRNCGGGHPVESDTQGTVLLSGFSPSMLKLVLNGEVLEKENKEVMVEGGDVVLVRRPEKVTPAEILRKSLDESLYDPVRAILLESREGILAEYQNNQNDEQERTEGAAEDDFEMVVVPDRS